MVPPLGAATAVGAADPPVPFMTIVSADWVAMSVRATSEIVIWETWLEAAATCAMPALEFSAVGACHAYAVIDALFGPMIEKLFAGREGGVVLATTETSPA